MTAMTADLAQAFRLRWSPVKGDLPPGSEPTIK